MAAETLTQTLHATIKSDAGASRKMLQIIKLAIVTSTVDGSCSIDTTEKLTGKLLQIVTDPGTPAPTNLYDLVLNHKTYGNDLAGGALADRLTATTQQVWPSDGTNPITHGVWLDDTLLTVVTSNQSEAGAKFDIYLFIEK
jgi:hypothetical protein